MFWRFLILILASIAGSVTSFAPAFAHFGLSGDEEIGPLLIWGWGILIVGIVLLLIYRRWAKNSRTPEYRALKRQLGDLKHAHKSCLALLRNADDYPLECGLSAAEYHERKNFAAQIQTKITKTLAEMHG